MSTESPAPAPRLDASPYRWAVLALGSSVIMTSIGFTRFAYTVIMPEMRRGLGLSYTDMGMIGTVGFAAYLLATLPAGSAVAHFGMRRTIASGLGLASAGLFGLALAPGFGVAAVANAVVQASSAAANVAGFAIVVPWFPVAQRGRAAGVVVGGAGLGIVLVGWLVPPLLTADAAGWRHGWMAVGATTLLVGAITATCLRNHPAAALGQARGQPGALAWADLARRPTLWVLAFVMGLFGFEYIVFGTFFAANLTANGWTIGAAGSLWSVVGLLMIGSGLVGGAVSDRIGRLPALGALFAAQAAASLLFALTTDGPGVYAAVALYGTTVMGFPAVASALCGDLVGPARASAAVAFNNVVFALGQTIGPTAAGAALDATGALESALLTGAAAALLGMVTCLIAARLEQ
jgi:predicted MFS family arabinose efflux permease